MSWLDLRNVNRSIERRNKDGNQRVFRRQRNPGGAENPGGVVGSVEDPSEFPSGQRWRRPLVLAQKLTQVSSLGKGLTLDRTQGRGRTSTELDSRKNKLCGCLEVHHRGNRLQDDTAKYTTNLRHPSMREGRAGVPSKLTYKRLQNREPGVINLSSDFYPESQNRKVNPRGTLYPKNSGLLHITHRVDT